MEEQQLPESESGTVETGDGMKPADSGMDSVLLFLGQLTKLFDRDFVVLNAKRTEKGVFVTKELADKLPAAYQKFLKELTGGGSSKSEEKCKRRLFGSDAPSAFYLFEGKQSIYGWVISVPTEKLASSELPNYRGSPVDATGYLHHKDPVFEECDFITAETDRSGFKIFVHSKQKKIQLDSTQVTKFADLVKESRTLQKYYPKAALSAREALRALAAALRKAKLANPRKEPFFVPAKYQSAKGMNFLKLGASYFVCSQAWELVDVYETRGPNLRDILIKDYDQLVIDAARSGSRKKLEIDTRYFRLTKRRGLLLGEVLTETRKYPLNAHAISDFCSRVHEVRPKLEFPKPLFTIVTLLRELSERYQQAELLRDARGKMGKQGKGEERKGQDRKNGNLIYSLDSKSNIRNVSLVGEGKQSEVSGKSKRSISGGRRSQDRRQSPRKGIKKA